MARVLVTGGAGFIGHHTVDLLVTHRHRVSVIDNLTSGNRPLIDAHLYVMDITSGDIRKVFCEERPDYVVLLASQVGVGPSLTDPVNDANVNILGTVNLLENCSRFGVQKVVFASSAAVYGAFHGEKATEECEPNPQAFYGLSKLTAERYIRMYGRQHGLNYTILRYSNVYGMGQESSRQMGVVLRFLRSALSGDPPVVYGDGFQTRDFVFVQDIARANLAALTRGNDQIVNASSGSATTVIDLLTEVAGVTGVNLHPVYAPRAESDISHSILDNSKAASVLGWKPETDLRSGLLRTYQHLRNRGDVRFLTGVHEEPAALSTASTYQRGE